MGGIVVLVQPTHGHVEQSIIVDAPPDLVYREINGYKSFSQWSPWYNIEPDASFTLEGPASGKGAKISWDGKKLKKGSQWIEESVENQKVRNALTYDGSQGLVYNEFILSPMGGGTSITWNFECTNNDFTSKFKWVFMEIMINDLYSAGLMDLQRYVEKIGKKNLPTK